MHWKKAAALFFGMWAVLFVMCVTMDSQLTTAQQIGYTAAMALVAPLLYFVSERVSSGKKGKRFSVHRVGEEEILCRVEGEWICPGTDERPTHYIRKGRVFAFDQKGALYSIKDDKVYRTGAEQPFLRLEGDKVRSCENGEIVYELRELEPPPKHD